MVIFGKNWHIIKQIARVPGVASGVIKTNGHFYKFWKK